MLRRAGMYYHNFLFLVHQSIFQDRNYFLSVPAMSLIVSLFMSPILIELLFLFEKFSSSLFMILRSFSLARLSLDLIAEMLRSFCISLISSIENSAISKSRIADLSLDE